jgi:TetR/AcrR family transcriptional repressor of nem operon
MMLEAYETIPALRKACDRSINGHAATLEADIQAVIDHYGLSPDWSAKSMALQVQAVMQGAFILAKAKAGPAAAADSIDHLRRCLELLFRPDEGRALTWS